MSRDGSRQRLEEILYSEAPTAPRTWTSDRANVHRAPSGVFTLTLQGDAGNDRTGSTVHVFDPAEVERLLVRAGCYPGMTT